MHLDTVTMLHIGAGERARRAPQAPPVPRCQIHRGHLFFFCGCAGGRALSGVSIDVHAASAPLHALLQSSQLGIYREPQMIPRIFAIAIALVLLSCLAGCGKARRPPAHPLPPTALLSQADVGNPGGRLVLASSAAPKTFNPL